MCNRAGPESLRAHVATSVIGKCFMWRSGAFGVSPAVRKPKPIIACPPATSVPSRACPAAATRRSQVDHPQMWRQPGTRGRIGRSEHQDRRRHRAAPAIRRPRFIEARDVGTHAMPARLVRADGLLVSGRIRLHFLCRPGTLRGFPAALRREGM